MQLNLVVAVAENGVIGRAGRLPWRLSSDLKSFRRLTMGKPVIMGRKTFQSIGKPLDGRDNIVLTRDPQFRPPGVLVAATIEEAAELARGLAGRRGVADVMVIGGADIFRLALPLATRIYLTRVHARPEGDTVFPEPDPAEWREVSRDPLPQGARDEHPATLIVLERTKR